MSDTFVQDFESKLFELFPDAKTNGVVKNSELLETMIFPLLIQSSLS
jgi:hypothetical protein